MYTSVEFVWMEGGEVERDAISFYGPAPMVGDLIGLLEDAQGDVGSIPTGDYFVRQRTLILPAMRWDVIAWSLEYLNMVDASEEEDQNPDDPE